MKAHAKGPSVLTDSLQEPHRMKRPVLNYDNLSLRWHQVGQPVAKGRLYLFPCHAGLPVDAPLDRKNTSTIGQGPDQQPPLSGQVRGVDEKTHSAALCRRSKKATSDRSVGDVGTFNLPVPLR